MSSSPCSQPEETPGLLLSLLHEQAIPAALYDEPFLRVDDMDELGSELTGHSDSVLLLADSLGSELSAAIERVQLTMPNAAIVVALANRPNRDAIRQLILSGVQEVVALELESIAAWQDVLHIARSRKHHESQLKRFSHYDPLTQLANRSLFQDRLEHSLLQSQRRERGMGILFLDIDRFRVVNDIYGHHIGDQLLVACTQRMLEKVRRSDTLARLGSNNFAVLLDDIADAEGMQRVADKLSSAFNRPFTIAGYEIFISVSIGMELAARVDYELGQLVRHAELALHQAKRNGRNASLIYQGDRSPADKVRMGLESALHHAMERQELHIVYQPQAVVDSGVFVGVEALLRWQHPVLGNVPPSVFIPVLEDTGLIESFGQWVLEQSCQQFADWVSAGHLSTRTKLSVNLSPRQFRQGDLVHQVQRALNNSGLPAQCLTLEVTESMLMNNLDQSVEMLTQLRQLGMSVAIDDFGTGYSSLSYLKDLPIDYLKIDRVFVKDIVDDANDAAIANSIIGLAHNLGLKVIAEGVEEAETLEMLRLFGCDQYQGYFYSKPAQPDEVMKLFMSE